MLTVLTLAAKQGLHIDLLVIVDLCVMVVRTVTGYMQDLCAQRHMGALLPPGIAL